MKNQSSAHKLKQAGTHCARFFVWKGRLVLAFQPLADKNRGSYSVFAF
jgi:hypothetical protein